MSAAQEKGVPSEPTAAPTPPVLTAKAEGQPEVEGRVEEQARRKPGPKPRPQVPSLGRVVHYETEGNGTRAAIISAVGDDNVVSLVVFNSLGAVPVTPVPFAEEPTEGHWSWPPRV